MISEKALTSYNTPDRLRSCPEKSLQDPVGMKATAVRFKYQTVSGQLRKSMLDEAAFTAKLWDLLLFSILFNGADFREPRARGVARRAFLSN